MTSEKALREELNRFAESNRVLAEKLHATEVELEKAAKRTDDVIDHGRMLIKRLEESEAKFTQATAVVRRAALCLDETQNLSGAMEECQTLLIELLNSLGVKLYDEDKPRPHVREVELCIVNERCQLERGHSGPHEWKDKP